MTDRTKRRMDVDQGRPLLFSAETTAALIRRLEEPFDTRVIEWRVTNTSRNNGDLRGQIIPYADSRAYTDRLNELFTPAGWTRKYSLQTSANFERSRDQKTVAKVFVTCELIIHGLGSHSATGEAWGDIPNACAAAEAQAFKRSAACFGLGRYLYHFDGLWVDLDERKRPKATPRLTAWATIEGWRQGLRPGSGAPALPPDENRAVPAGEPVEEDGRSHLIGQVEALGLRLGKGLYRGILKSAARVWQPSQIREASGLEKVLEQMRAAEQILERFEAARKLSGPETLSVILSKAGIGSMERVDSVRALNQIVLELEAKAGREAV